MTDTKATYWEHQATSATLGDVAECDLGTGCMEEDFIGLVRLGVRFPEVEDNTHDIDAVENRLREEGARFRSKSYNKFYVNPEPIPKPRATSFEALTQEEWQQLFDMDMIDGLAD